MVKWKVLLPLIALSLAADPARALLCVTRGGTLKVRAACKRRETPVDPLTLGLQAFKGEKGDKGDPGDPGPAGPSGSGAAAFAQTINGVVLDANSLAKVLDLNTGETHTGPLSLPFTARVFVSVTLEFFESGPTTSASPYCQVSFPAGTPIANRPESILLTTNSESRELTLNAAAAGVPAGSFNPEVDCAENSAGAATLSQATMLVWAVPDS